MRAERTVPAAHVDPVAGTGAPMPPLPHPVPASLSRRRLLVALALVLAVPGALGVAALRVTPPELSPSVTAPEYPPLPQTPGDAARAQFDRSREALRLVKRLPGPRLLSPAATGTARPDALPTLVLGARQAPYALAELRKVIPTAFADVGNPAPAPDPGTAALLHPVPGTALLLKAHLEVAPGATLVLDDRTPDIRLASSPSDFATLLSRGTLTIAGSDKAAVRISSWDTTGAGPDANTSDGRPFVLQIGGRMDVDRARVEYLGFGTGTTSGIAWRGALDETPTDPGGHVEGIVTNSTFTHNHFGAYTHRAKGMHWSRNVFSANEEYGFDPHDFSDDFLVEDNEAFANGKHGFIFSRGCLRNVMRNNVAHDNAGHGFMIDDGRSAPSEVAVARVDVSNDNRIENNVAERNRGSGVEIEGGTGNVIANNRLTGNYVGVRIKNGASTTVTGNAIVGSARYGVDVLDGHGTVPIGDNTISGSWGGIDLATHDSAVLGNNAITEVSAPLVVGGVAVREVSTAEKAAQIVRWNPMLVLWTLILGTPVPGVALRVLRPRRPSTARPPTPVWTWRGRRGSAAG
jgi:parallel beta-helix repeat protein